MEQLLACRSAPVDGLVGNIRLLRRSDIPGAMHLKDAAGWNQTEQDWERILELEPEGCFALEVEGVLAATAAVLVYGEELAWIGMVLTLPEFRGHGFARRLMQRTMDYIQGRRVATVRLDATDMGIGLYRRFGFEMECLVERWERPAGGEPIPEAALDPWECDPELDRPAFGGDRTRLLASLARAEAASAGRFGYAMGRAGYAMGRAGSKAPYFGPCVAQSACVAERLLRWFLARHPAETVYWDVLPGNSEAVRVAREYGFHPVRRLTRMSHQLRPCAPASSPDLSQVFAIAGFEYG